MHLFHLVLHSLSIYQLALAGIEHAWLIDQDLSSFVTRPDLRPPRWIVNNLDPSETTPGYWFLAPYSDIKPAPLTSLYSPCQIGPVIYDNNGELIWSGACLFGNRNSYDFKAVGDDDENANLSLILGHLLEQTPDRHAKGVVLDSHLEIIQDISAPKPSKTGYFLHEFTILDAGRKALRVTSKAHLLKLAELGEQAQWTDDNGFQEVNLETGKVVFEWSALRHVALSESRQDRVSYINSSSDAWDYFHLNSVEKTQGGDYIISARHTDTIYLISGKDGSVLWRLGGANSSFIHLDNFTFLAQHDARILEEGPDGMMISFLDNASASGRVQTTSNTSSAVMVKLTTSTPMTAHMLRTYPRPDGKYSRKRGNAQMLPNGNMAVGWSEYGYTSEFTDSGRCVFEAKFASHRFSTYRSYKFNISLTPSEPPSLNCAQLGPDIDSAMTVFYVSWNGATHVASWKFSSVDDPTGSTVFLGGTERTGFETISQTVGWIGYAVVEALDADGRRLGASAAVQCNPVAGRNIQNAEKKQAGAVSLTRLPSHVVAIFEERLGGNMYTWCGELVAAGVLLWLACRLLRRLSTLPRFQ